MIGCLAAVGSIGLEELLQALAVFVIFVLPGIKASRDAKKKKHGSRPRIPAAPGPEPRAEPQRGQPSGKELWERLLRGEIEPAGPPAPSPGAGAPRPKEARKPRPPESKPRPQPIVREPLSAPIGDAKGLAQRAIQRQPLPPPLPQTGSENALEEGLSALESLASPFGSPVGEARGEVDSEVAETQPARITIEAPGSMDDWRRAIVMAEVLGGAVALREGGGPGSPPGFS